MKKLYLKSWREGKSICNDDTGNNTSKTTIIK